MSSPRRLVSAARPAILLGLLVAEATHAVDQPADPAPSVGTAEDCQRARLALQILGSGGPDLSGDRASTSYLIWQDRRPRVLIDAGPGSALRFASAGASVASLDLVVLTHLHVDHVADLSSLVKASFFGPRTKPLPIFGPAEGPGLASTEQMIHALFDPEEGIYRYLGGFLKGHAAYTIEPHDLSPRDGELKEVFTDKDMRVSATSVHHGPFPSLGWRIEVGGQTLVFTGDTSGMGRGLDALASGATLLVAHHAIPEGPGQPTHLHMPPSRIGALAKAADPHALVLSHWMRRTLDARDRSLPSIRAHWSGPLVEAEDLQCIVLTPDDHPTSSPDASDGPTPQGPSERGTP